MHLASPGVEGALSDQRSLLVAGDARDGQVEPKEGGGVGVREVPYDGTTAGSASSGTSNRSQSSGDH